MSFECAACCIPCAETVFKILLLPFLFTGRLFPRIPISEGLPGRLCGGQASLLRHPGSAVGNNYWHIRGTELWRAQHWKDRKRLYEQFEKRTKVVLAHRWPSQSFASGLTGTWRSTVVADGLSVTRDRSALRITRCNWNFIWDTKKKTDFFFFFLI